MRYKSIRGMEDILPEDIEIWQWLERVARIDLESYGFKEIRTPLLEETPVFIGSIGDTTDIVKKEMYTFKDKKGRSLTLRPEGTAPIVRAYVANSLGQKRGGSKLYYIGPMFRSEKPQKGRRRQFHQIGIEVFGSKSYFTDAEVIMQLDDMLRNVFKLDGFTIKLNSLGCKKICKPNFTNKLKRYLKDKQNRLCTDCKNRMKKNVLRILDCKNDSCIQVVRNAPNVHDSLCEPCKNHYDKLKETLDKLNIRVKETKNLVRGLDYYTGTVFEITHPSLGAQDAIGAGGRYDNLVKDMGGPDTGAIGYALGMERLIIALQGETASTDTISKDVIFLATLGDMAKTEGLRLAHEIRKKRHIQVITNTQEASLKSQMRAADKVGAKFVIILGENELKKNVVILRDMALQEQKEVSRNKVFGELK